VGKGNLMMSLIPTAFKLKITYSKGILIISGSENYCIILAMTEGVNIL